MRFSIQSASEICFPTKDCVAYGRVAGRYCSKWMFGDDGKYQLFPQYNLDKHLQPDPAYWDIPIPDVKALASMTALEE